MKLNKRQTYFAALIAGISICLLYQCFWIFSSTARAEILGTYTYKRGSAGNISLMKASYTVNYETHVGYYLKDGYDADKRFFEVRYLLFAPDISRTNNFTINWGPLILFFIFWFIVTTIAFVRKDIIADQAIFLLNKRPPFFKLIHNEIEDYDQHEITHEQLNNEEKEANERILKERASSHEKEVKAGLSKFNPNAIFILVIYIIFFFGFFAVFFSGRMGLTLTLMCIAILVLVPPWIQSTNNPAFEMQIPDHGALIFSPKGVECRKYFYPIEDIESAAVYLESFNGFKCRDRSTIGKSKTRFYGDNNKISFRNNGEITDFTFILESAKDYWAFKNLMAVWSERGVNIFLQKVFEDEFIIQEMVHFHILDT